MQPAPERDRFHVTLFDSAGPMIIAVMPFLVAIVAILAGTYVKVQKENARTAAQLGRATDHLEEELAAAQAERARLRQRIEALEAIVTSEGYDLEREARRAGIGRIDADLLDLPAPEGSARASRRVRE